MSRGGPCPPLPWRGPSLGDARGDAGRWRRGRRGPGGAARSPEPEPPPPPPEPSMVMAEPRRPPALLPRGLGPVRVGFYDIEGTLGKGNFAVVKLARHRITRSEVGTARGAAGAARGSRGRLGLRFCPFRHLPVPGTAAAAAPAAGWGGGVCPARILSPRTPARPPEDVTPKDATPGMAPPGWRHRRRDGTPGMVVASLPGWHPEDAPVLLQQHFLLPGKGQTCCACRALGILGFLHLGDQQRNLCVC